MNSATKVGMFMVIVLAILGFFILKIEDIRPDRATGTKKVRVVFDSVAGLDNKSAVRVAGVRVGKVLSIKLTPDGRALVTLEVDKDVQLHQGASARVANLGLLGEKYVELEPGNPAAPPMTTGPSVVLRGSQPASIDDVTNQVSAIANDVKAITTSLRTTMAGPGGQQRLDEIVENIRQITRQVRVLIAANEGNVNATAENIRQITADLRVEIPKIAANIDRMTGQLGGTVGENREDVRAIIENLRGLSADLRVTANNLNAVTGQVKSGEGTVGKLLYSEEAHDRLVGALASVESGVTELKNTLGRANKIGMDLSIKADYLAGMQQTSETFAGNSRSALQLRLLPDPQKNRFYNFELAEDPRGNLDEKIVETTVTDPATGVTTTTRTHQTKIQRDFVLSAQAGWQLDRLGLRVGLFDSTGGVGADYGLNPRLSVTGEAFDFGQKVEDNPHLRLYGRYVLRNETPKTPQLFLTSGVDDVLNDTAFIFGGGIRWRDDDLKYLLGSVPIK